MYNDTKKMLSDAKFYEGYSRFDDAKGRYETWEEAVDRVMTMHGNFYSHVLSPDLAPYFTKAIDAYKGKLVLGAQRALQFGGDQIIKHQMRMYNCLNLETRFLTSEGMKSFLDFEDGDSCIVETHKNNWKKAIVRYHGKQQTFNIVLRNKSSVKTVRATKDHRWILKDGSVTTNLKLGDSLYQYQTNYFNDFVWETATPQEQLYWCYGYVYGDGSVGTSSLASGNGQGKPYSKVRLCGPEVERYLHRFESFGWKTSRSLSLNGDVIVFTGLYAKTLPDVSTDSRELIRAFVAGYLAADGAKATGFWEQEGTKFGSIYAKKEQAQDFIRDVFPLAGVVINSERKLNVVTNFGINDGSHFNLSTIKGGKYATTWTVESITPFDLEMVACLEVEDDHSFTLEGGIITGNCTSSYADRPSFFGEIFYILLCGAGAGFSVQKQHIQKLPYIVPRTKQPKTHVVEDSIEGWATALDVLMSSYFEGGGKHPEYQGRRVFFELTGIRQKGAEISGGFKAPGPEPLRRALDKIEYILQGIALSGKRTLMRAIQVYDIVMHTADAVLAGGVRRSATNCLFSKDDVEMINAKTGNWFVENPQRARSNNSAVINRNTITETEFSDIMDSIRDFGEPGFFFVDDEDITTNPCVEIGMYPQIDGKSGWQGCNLTEINGGMVTTPELFYQACEAAAILGTLQAGYTDFRFLDPTSKEIFDREALLGVSVTGWMNNPDILFDPEVLEKGAKIVLETNKKVALLLGINPAARTTCVKPSGNASVLLMTASGIHAEHAPMYIRNIQLPKDAEVAQLIQKTNPYMIEESVWSAGKSDVVVSFPVVSKEGSIYKDELFGVEHLKKVALVQQYWVNAGTDVSLCAHKDVRHNVSNTIDVDSWELIEDYVFHNRHSFAGISFMAASGDKAFNQAPNTKVITAEEIVGKYGTGSVFASGLVVDGLKAFDNIWLACDAANSRGQSLDLYPGEDHAAIFKKDWVRRFDKFALNYFKSKEEAEHCLKDVFLLHKWEKIQQNLVDINWYDNLTRKKFTDINTTGAAACVGQDGCLF